MKILLLSFSIFLSAFSAFSQQVNAVWGPDLSDEYFLKDWKIVDKNETDITIVEERALNFFQKDRQYYLKKCGRKTLDVKSEKLLFTTLDIKDYYYHSANRIGNDMAIFFIKLSEKPYQLYYKLYSLTGEAKGGFVKVPGMGLDQVNNIDPESSFSIQTEYPDKIAFMITKFKSERNYELVWSIFTGNINTVTSGNSAFSVSIENPVLRQMSTDFNSSVILVLGEDVDLDETYTSETLVSVNISSKKSVTQKIEFPGLKIWYSKFLLFPGKDEVMGVGIYSDENLAKKLSGRGVVSMKLNKTTGTLNKVDQSAFSPEVVEVMAGKAQAKKNKGVGNKVKVRSVTSDPATGGFMAGIEKGYSFGVKSDGFLETGYQLDNALFCLIDPQFKITSLSPQERTSMFVEGRNFNKPHYTILKKGKVKCILLGQDRFEYKPLSSDPPSLKTLPLLYFNEKNIVERKEFELARDKKKRVYYAHTFKPLFLAENEVLLFADAYKDKFTNPYRTKGLSKKYVIMRLE